MSAGRQWSRCSRPRPRLIRWAVTGPCAGPALLPGDPDPAGDRRLVGPYRSDPRQPGVRHHAARPSGRVDRRRDVRGPHRSARGDRIIGLDPDDVAVDGSLYKAPHGGRAPAPTPPAGPSRARSGPSPPNATASRSAGPSTGPRALPAPVARERRDAGPVLARCGEVPHTHAAKSAATCRPSCESQRTHPRQHRDHEAKVSQPPTDGGPGREPRARAQTSAEPAGRAACSAPAAIT
jgi:hypothetical protein